MDKQNPHEYKEKSKAHFEEASSHYSDTYAGKYTEPMHDAVIQELEGMNFSTLLDVGCGTGIFLSIILKKFSVNTRSIEIFCEFNYQVSV